MEDGNEQKNNPEYTKDKNTNNSKDNINKEPQVSFKQQEIVHKNLEPKDNIQKANHRRLKNSEKQRKLVSDSELKLKENRKIFNKNLNEKDINMSKSELNKNKTFGFFNKEKESNKDNVINSEKKVLHLYSTNNNFNQKSNNSLLSPQKIIDNNMKQFPILTNSFKNLNNKIEFNDNKVIHIKKEKKLALEINSGINSNDINNNIGNDIIINNFTNNIQKNLFNENLNFRNELSNEKLPLDNMRHKLRKKDEKNEKEVKINKIDEDKIQKDDKNISLKEKINDNKIFNIDIIEETNEKNELSKEKNFDKKDIIENKNNINLKSKDEKNIIINIEFQKIPENNSINYNPGKQEEKNENNNTLVKNDNILKTDIKEMIFQKEESIKPILNNNNRKISEEEHNRKSIQEIIEIENGDNNIIKDDNNKIDKDKEKEIIITKEETSKNKEPKENNEEKKIIISSKNREIDILNKQNVHDKIENNNNNSMNNIKKIEEIENKLFEKIKEHNITKNLKSEEKNKKTTIIENDNILKKQQKIFVEKNNEIIKKIDFNLNEEKIEALNIRKKINKIHLKNVDNILKEEINKINLDKNLNLDINKNNITEEINSDIEILNLNNIKEKYDSNKASEKNKIITDFYKIKIDIEKPTESINTINTNNDEAKELNNKNEKLVESIIIDESDENKENIQNNFQNSDKKSDNTINTNKEKKENKVILEKIENILENKVEIIDNVPKMENEKNETEKFLQSEKKENDKIQTIKEDETIPSKESEILKNKLIDNIIREIEIIKPNENINSIENNHKSDSEKENKNTINNHDTIEKETDINYQRNENNYMNLNNIQNKKELKTKPINKNSKNVKLNKELELNNKKFFQKNKYKKEVNQSEDKIKRNQKIISPFRNKFLRNAKKDRKKLTKEQFFPLSHRNQQNNIFQKKNSSIIKTMESNDKLNDIKIKKKNEIKEKRMINKSYLKLNYDLNLVTKYYKTELSFKSSRDKLLLKESKPEKKSFQNKSNIISIDKMKNAKNIINRKKKLEKILREPNKYSSKSFNSKINKSQKLNLIKEKKETKKKKNELRNLLLKSEEININVNKNKSNGFSSSCDSDLGDVGEIIEDEVETELGPELLNEINENNFINNPKSIITYSSSILMKKNEKKRLSLSLNKIDNNFFSSSKYNNKTENVKERNKYYKLKNAEDIKDKIKKKENDIEKLKKLIEIAKRNIKYYDKRILEVENFIKCEEQLRNEYQLMINFFNLK